MSLFSVKYKTNFIVRFQNFAKVSSHLQVFNNVSRACQKIKKHKAHYDRIKIVYFESFGTENLEFLVKVLKKIVFSHLFFFSLFRLFESSSA